MISERDLEALTKTMKLNEDRNTLFWGFNWESRGEKAGCARSGNNPAVTFGIYCDGGGCIAEASIRWLLLGEDIAPRLECFDDALCLLQTETFGKLLKAIRSLQGTTLDVTSMSDIFFAFGFTDLDTLSAAAQNARQLHHYCITMERTVRSAIWFDALSDDAARRIAGIIFSAEQQSARDDSDEEWDYALCEVDTGRMLVDWD